MFGTINLINAAIQKGVDRNIPRCVACSRCGLGGTHYAAIDPTGRVFTCQDMSSFENEASPFYLGNIFTGIDNSRREFMVTDYDTRRCSGKDCEKCRMNRVCDGGCVANNYMKSGDTKSVSIVHCEWYQMLLEEAIRVMRLLGSEHNETFKQIWSVYNG
ncbi:hypothetical protein SDC9_47672 [bioreactor metagenome]|uniref:4Fe4S-binding SPASM domain-containing protein n=1 Tax=bioreactor metagenome TaxID=1076179 RepID=A0A644WCG2_9ZZZZ